MYFLCPRKVGIFGVCCEGLPQQVNFLIDESHNVSKGSSAVISYLHYFFENYALGEVEVDLHCDNCSGQNKNNYVLAYLMWRTIVGLHQRISVHFLIAGHTKFSPDWCFGLLKKSFRRTDVSTLQELADCVKSSTRKNVNIPQIVGPENGPAVVPVFDWLSFLMPRTVPLLKDNHHFSFNACQPGTLEYKEFNRSEVKTFMMLKTSLSEVINWHFNFIQLDNRTLLNLKFEISFKVIRK